MTEFAAAEVDDRRGAPIMPVIGVPASWIGFVAFIETMRVAIVRPTPPRQVLALRALGGP